MILSLALLQQVAMQAPMGTPDTTGSMAAGYAAVGILLVGYTIYLWARYRKAR